MDRDTPAKRTKRPTGRPTGRPPLSEEPSVNVAFRLPADLGEAFKSAAGTGLSARTILARRYIVEGLKRDGFIPATSDNS